jgi:fucose permease
MKAQTELQTMHGEADEPSLVLLTRFPISSTPGNMLNMRGWQCCKHCIVVTTVVFVWGFTYGILTSLNSRTPNMANGSLAQVVSIVSVFYGGCLFGAFIGQWVLRFSGFKASLITGLAIFCLGTLMYWPSGALDSYPAFVVSNFIVGIGLSVIELAACLFLLLCGAPQYADIRLLIALGIQIVASLLSGLLSRRVFLVNVVSTQWVYLGCALAVTLLALFLYYTRLPEASDAELQSQTDALKHLYNQSCFDKPRIFRLNRVLFFLAIFTSEGGVQSLEIFFAYLLPSVAEATNTAQSISTNDYYMVGTGMFAFSRFLCALLCLFIPPRILLLVSFIGATVFSALTMGLHTGNFNSTATYGLMIAFFEGPLSPLIFSMGVRGLGSWTKVGGALLVAAQSGASVFPFVMLGVIQSAGRSVQYSFCVALATFAAGTAFAVYINIFRPLHDQLDPVAMPVAVQRRPTIVRVEIDEPVATGVFQAKQHS